MPGSDEVTLPRALPRPDWCAVARDLWATVTEGYHLSNPQTFVLRAACDATDRAETAREIVTAEGATFTTSTGQIRQHPAVQIEREARAQSLRAIEMLRLEIPDDTR